VPKAEEIAYIANMSRVLGVSREEVEASLLGKPYVEAMAWYYLLDVGQILRLLPPPPSRVLDLGAGPGWTSELIARCGHSVVGTDLAPDMVELARRRIEPGLDLRFEVRDYEEPVELGEFDAVLLYDALHHALHEARVIETAFGALRPGGLLLTLEPGTGHAAAPATRDAVEKFGTTEKDMDFEHQARLMRAAGFGEIRRYPRLNQLVLVDVEASGGEAAQADNLRDVLAAMRSGLTSVVVAERPRARRDGILARLGLRRRS
jgi:SAM-dependent methyltransferase